MEPFPNRFVFRIRRWRCGDEQSFETAVVVGSDTAIHIGFDDHQIVGFDLVPGGPVADDSGP